MCSFSIHYSPRCTLPWKLQAHIHWPLFSLRYASGREEGAPVCLPVSRHAHARVRARWVAGKDLLVLWAVATL